ncbi:hypothetical protein AC578_7253 [Pseudocercospora eumusae]|uniref:Zn(2)-C6 fungal-type domain-containing protein n=1 Tax=Pseudocercospora eumusae TaxID=321146 RepID=A0A139HX04_9PEZI|nr:hypothetical protein AC578_7253 [Pseudocercospora eumusae]
MSVPRPNGRSPPLREACNNCAQRKIRCNKTDGACKRCRTKGLICEFSYSRRIGRHPGALADWSMAKDGKTTTRLNEFDWNVLEKDFEQDQALLSSPNDTAEPGPHDIISDTPFIDVEPDIMLSGQCDTEGTSSLAVDTSSSNVVGISCSDTEGELNASSTSVPSPVEPCIAKALRLVSLLLLKNNNTRRHLTTCGTHVSTGQGSTISQNSGHDIDQILLENKTHIQSLLEVLQCSCAKTSTVITMCLIAADKITTRYNSLISSGDDVKPGTSDCGITQPMYIGSYRLDTRMQKEVQIAVVHSELREQMRPLVTNLELCIERASQHKARGSVTERSLTFSYLRRLQSKLTEAMDDTGVQMQCDVEQSTDEELRSSPGEFGDGGGGVYLGHQLSAITSQIGSAMTTCQAAVRIVPVGRRAFGQDPGPLMDKPRSQHQVMLMLCRHY